MSKTTKKMHPKKAYKTAVKTHNRKKVKKSHHKNAMIVYYPSVRQLPIPPRYKTKMTAEFFGYTNSGAGSGDYNWFMKANSIQKPFGVTSGMVLLTPNNISFVTYECPGFTQLVNSNFYCAFRVLSSKISLDIVNQSILDGVTAVITPSFNNTSGPTTVAAAMAQPFSKVKEFSSGRTNGLLVNYITPEQVKGCSRRAIDDDLSGQFTGAFAGDPSQLLFWIINVETGDNSILNLPLEIRIKIEYYVELFSLSQYGLIPQT